MALPAEYDTVTVTGKYVYLDGTPARGSVKFTGKIVATAAASHTVIVPAAVTAQLSASGEFAVQLPATDDPDITPNGWTYRVDEQLTQGGGRTFDLDVPIAAKPTGIDISTVAPVSPSDGDPTAFATASSVALIAGRVYDVREYGAIADDSTDNTTAIQAALTAAQTAGGGVVFVPKGIYRSGPLTLGQRVALRGAGYGSVLKHKGGTGHLLATLNTSVDLFSVADLFLDCWLQTAGSGAAGISITSNAAGYSTGYQDAHHNVRDVLITGTAGAGVSIASGGREIRLHNVVVRDPRAGHGFDLQGTDNFLSMCTAATTRTPSHGFYVHGSNTRLVGCKAFYCGLVNESSDGFYVDRGRVTMVGCEAQDNGRWGFNLLGGSDHSSYAGLVGDSNGKGGIKVDNSGGTVTGVSLTGFASYSRSGGRYAQQYGVQFTGASHAGNVYVGSARDNTVKDVDGTTPGATFLVNAATGDQLATLTGRGSAAPTTGTWKLGDLVWNTAPTASGTLGWICVSAGTPGTWKTFGSISA